MRRWTNCGAQRVCHGLLGFHAAVFFAGECMQQEDGVVHRARKLQNRADRVRHERNFSEKQVGAHADDDGDTHDHQKQQRLKPRGGRERQNKEDDHHGEHHDVCDLGVDGRTRSVSDAAEPAMTPLPSMIRRISLTALCVRSEESLSRKVMSI